MDQKLAHIFGEAQASAATHRKYITLLKRIQAEAYEDGEEEVFNQSFHRMVNKVLPIRKNEPSADRIIKLVAEFVECIVTDEKIGESEMTLYFTDQLVRHIMQGIEARDKNVRFRVCQLLSRMLHHMTFLPTNLHEKLSDCLYRRLHDKETHVRTQAVICIARLQEDDEQNGEEMCEAAKNLLIAMENDSSAEVRRAAMLNLVIGPSTFDSLVQRARDVNTTNRRIFYSRLMLEMNRYRAIASQREKILSWGLHDREESVRRATAKMFGIQWMKSVKDDVIGILERLDVTHSEIAERALQVMYQLRPDVVENVCLTAKTWKSLTSEVALLVRTLYDHLCENNLDSLVEENYGDAMELSELIKNYFKARRGNLRREGVYLEETPEPTIMGGGKIPTERGADLERRDEEKNPEERSEEDEENEGFKQEFTTPDLNFTLDQLMRIALKYDYSDEIGRRQMLHILRTGLSKDKLGDELTKSTLQVLRKISISEKDFIQMIIEIITDIRDFEIDKREMDTSDGDSFHSAADEFPPESRHPDEPSAKVVQSEALKEVPPKEAILQCLMIAQHMLELIEESMHGNMLLVGLMNTLITPAIKSRELDIRMVGLKCVGLCCLLNRQLSMQQLHLIANCAKEGDLVSRIVAIQSVCDILALHGFSILESCEELEPIFIAELFYACIADDSEPQMQAVAAEGVFKLFLADIFGDDGLFETLVFAFFDGSTSENDELKQCLTFCIPTYAFSRTGHQDRIVRIATSTLLKCFEMYDSYEDKSRVLSHNSMVQNFVFWTDASNIPNIEDDALASSASHIKLGVQLMDLALQLQQNKSALKAVVSSFSKLVFTHKAGIERLTWLSERLDEMKNEMREKKFVLDFVCKNAILKLERNIKMSLQKCEAVRSEEVGDLSKIKEESDCEMNAAEINEDENAEGDKHAEKFVEPEGDGDQEDADQEDADQEDADQEDADQEDADQDVEEEDEAVINEVVAGDDESDLGESDREEDNSEEESDEDEEPGTIPQKRTHSESGSEESDVSMESS